MAGINSQDVTTITEIAAKAGPSGQSLSEPERMALHKALSTLQAVTSTPMEATIEVTAGDVKFALIRVAIDLGIFNAMAGGKPVHLVDLLASTKADEELLVRLFRFLTTTGVVTQIGPTTWAPSAAACAWVDGSPLRDILVHFQGVSAVVSQLPSYLAKHNYRMPRDYNDGPFQSVFQEDFWTWLTSEPERRATFDRFMIKNHLDGEEMWYDIYPIEKLSVHDASRPLLVDIGGGLGFSVQSLKKQKPEVQGKVILQEMPEVIAQAKERAKAAPAEYEGIDELMPYNFFSSQPVRNALVYYLRCVLHDWPDASALKILANIREAMPADAVLLVNEWILPEQDVPLFPTWIDWQMMAMFSGHERTRDQWLALFKEAKFELLKIYEPKEIAAGAGFVFELKPRA